MNCLQAAASGPCSTTHASRSFLVSGQLQQIFLPDLPNLGAGFVLGVASAAYATVLPIVEKLGFRARFASVRNTLVRAGGCLRATAVSVQLNGINSLG